MRDGAPGASRTVPVWHTAQFRPTWSMPSRRRRDTPIGRSCPGSTIRPSDAKPPGNLSRQISGMARKIQYGGRTPPTGRSSETPGSLPMEPYLN